MDFLSLEAVIIALPCSLKTFFWWVGFILIAQYAIRVLYILFSLPQPIRRDITKRYGKGSWAVITGATDGIGKEFAFQLAAKEFNIVLISRTQKKLDDTAKEIKEKYPSTKTLTVQADFEQAYDTNLYNKIYSSLESLDISILINNVGWDYIGGFLEQTEEFYRKLILINEVPQVILTKKVLPKLLKRTTKSAVISLSSIASVKPLPFFSVYSATKNFNKFFMLSIEKEYPEIDFLTVMPGYVSTQMNHNEKPVGDVLTKETAVKCYLNDLGVKNTTFGHWKHALQGYFYGWVNDTLYYFLYDNFIAKKMVARRREAIEKEKKGK